MLLENIEIYTFIFTKYNVNLSKNIKNKNKFEKYHKYIPNLDYFIKFYKYFSIVISTVYYTYS